MTNVRVWLSVQHLIGIYMPWETWPQKQRVKIWQAMLNLKVWISIPENERRELDISLSSYRVICGDLVCTLYTLDYVCMCVCVCVFNVCLSMCVYVCMYVCVCVCVYVMYVCMQCT